MTFCGDLLNAPMVVTFTRLRAVRRRGVNQRGRWRMSGARFTACHLPWTADSGCACLSPGERTQKGEKTRQGMSRNPPQRRKARARNGVAPYSPAAVDFRRGAGGAGHGATEAAHPGKDAASPGVASWDGSPKGGDGLPAPSTTARPDARNENGNGQKTENGRIRMDYMRLK